MVPNHMSSSDKDLQIIKARSVETSIQCTYKQLKKQPIFLSPPPHSTTVETAETRQHRPKSYSSPYLPATLLS